MANRLNCKRLLKSVDRNAPVGTPEPGGDLTIPVAQWLRSTKNGRCLKPVLWGAYSDQPNAVALLGAEQTWRAAARVALANPHPAKLAGLAGQDDNCAQSAATVA
jgi:hypothetical protein